MKQKKQLLSVLSILIIVAIVVLWAWHKENWWLLLAIPFSIFFFSNGHAVANSLGYVLTFVLGHMLFTLVSGHFQFAVWSWFFFLCALMAYASACIIYGTEKSNWEKKAKTNGDNRTFEKYEEDEFLNSPEIKKIISDTVDKYKK